jgi:hypothetical protein
MKDEHANAKQFMTDPFFAGNIALFDQQYERSPKDKRKHELPPMMNQ